MSVCMPTRVDTIATPIYQVDIVLLELYLIRLVLSTINELLN